jgi:hypothetical protein
VVRSGPERSGADRTGADRTGSDRSGTDRTGSDRIGPNRSGGQVLDGATFGAVWRTVAGCGVGRHPLVLPGVAHPLFLTGGWAQQQGEEEEGEHPLFVPGEGDEQGKEARGEKMMGEFGTGVKGDPVGNLGHRRVGCGCQGGST